MVLVTGGAGYIGSHTCVELLNAGYEVIVVDNLCNSHIESLERVQKITGKKLKFVKADVRDEQNLERIFSENKIDSVIHFAGLKAVGESVQKPLEYYDNNINASLVLCRVMKKYNVKTLVFSSSATVYSKNNTVPLKETSTTGDCTNPYGWTKYMSEKIFESMCIADPSMSVVLLRYFNPIGAHSSGLIGEDPQGIPNNLMPYICQVAVGRREILTVFGNDYDTPDGTGVRDYIHVVDLAKAHLCALKYGAGKKGCEAINIGTGKGTSVLELLHAMEKSAGKTIACKIGDRRPGDLATVYADCAKAEKVLGFKTELTIDDMCSSSWKWQSTNPFGYVK